MFSLWKLDSMLICCGSARDIKNTVSCRANKKKKAEETDTFNLQETNSCWKIIARSFLWQNHVGLFCFASVQSYSGNCIGMYLWKRCRRKRVAACLKMSLSRGGWRTSPCNGFEGWWLGLQKPPKYLEGLEFALCIFQLFFFQVLRGKKRSNFKAYSGVLYFSLKQMKKSL